MAEDRSTRRVLLVSALFFLLAMLRAGSMPLTDPDEGRYAEIAREMVASGDYVVPHLFSIPYLEKPPLLYWLTALSFGAFGESEIAARLVPALTATAGVVAVGLFASTLFAPASAVYAALALGRRRGESRCSVGRRGARRSRSRQPIRPCRTGSAHPG